jgi:competence protein ComFB
VGLIKNVLEKVLRDLLPDLYRMKPELCRCKQCEDDVLALALKALPSKYVSRDEGEVYARLELENPQLQVDMLEALLLAADKVIAHPRCSSGQREDVNPGKGVGEAHKEESGNTEEKTQ